MERDFNLLRQLALLNQKYHIGLIKYHCDLLKQAPKGEIETIKNRKKWQRIKQLKKKKKYPFRVLFSMLQTKIKKRKNKMQYLLIAGLVLSQLVFVKMAKE